MACLLYDEKLRGGAIRFGQWMDAIYEALKRKGWKEGVPIIENSLDEWGFSYGPPVRGAGPSWRDDPLTAAHVRSNPGLYWSVPFEQLATELRNENRWCNASDQDAIETLLWVARGLIEIQFKY